MAAATASATICSPERDWTPLAVLDVPPESPEEELPQPAAKAIAAVRVTNNGIRRISRRYQRVHPPHGQVTGRKRRNGAHFSTSSLDEKSLGSVQCSGHVYVPRKSLRLDQELAAVTGRIVPRHRPVRLHLDLAGDSA